MNPAVCDDGSLVFARNMKVDKDGCLMTDYGYDEISALADYNIIGHIVGLDNKIYFFTEQEKYVGTLIQYEHKLSFIEITNNVRNYNPISTYILDKIGYNHFNSLVNGYRYFYCFKTEQKGFSSDITTNSPEFKLSSNTTWYYSSVAVNATDYDNYLTFYVDYDGNYTHYLSDFITKLNALTQRYFNSLSDSTIVRIGNSVDNSTLYSSIPTAIYDGNVTLNVLSVDYASGDIVDDFVLFTYVPQDKKYDYRFDIKKYNIILEYDEIDKNIKIVEAAWSYSNGKIDGCVTTNVTKEKILTIAETKGTAVDEFGKVSDVDVPLKHINLSYCSYSDDESIYTQAPKVPIANVALMDTYAKVIPNGTYVFFIRYEIRKDVYTNWYLASHPIFAGQKEKISTLQGGINYINLHKDSAKSFILSVNYLTPEIKRYYKRFQLGFILSHEDSTNARSWKHFDIDTNEVYFDYEEVQEADIDELTRVSYELYNVGNITPFKNKLYISNYKESDINPKDIEDISELVKLGTTIDVLPSDTLTLNDKVLSQNSPATNEGLSVVETDGLYRSYDDGSKLSFDDDNTNIVVNELNAWNTKTTENAYKITGKKYQDGSAPDLYAIEQIQKNNVDGAVVDAFGNSNIYSFKTTEVSHGAMRWDKHTQLTSGFGIEAIKDSYEYRAHQRIVVYEPTNPQHKFYEQGLTAVYGSVVENSNTEQTAHIFRDDSNLSLLDGVRVLPFNKKTLAHIEITSNHPYDKDAPGIDKTYDDVWCATDNGIDDESMSAIRKNVKKEIEEHSILKYAYMYIADGSKTHIIDAADENIDKDDYIIDGDNLVNDVTFDKSGKVTENNLDIKGKIQTIITNNAVGINENGTIVCNFFIKQSNGKFTTITSAVSNVVVVYKRYTFSVETNGDVYTVNMTETEYQSVCEVSLKNFDVLNAVNASQANTLMPLSSYDAYIHFIDEHQIITNGTFLQSITTPGIPTNTNRKNNDRSVIKLNYTLNYGNVVLNALLYPHAFRYLNRYKAFFISLKQTGDTIIEGFNYTYKDGKHYLHSIEIDSMLYNINDNITIVDNNGNELTNNAKYYPSSSVDDIAFGNCGFIMWTDSNTYEDIRFYIKIKSKNSNNQLVKATPYIYIDKNKSQNVFDIVGDGFYGSYVCTITKPTIESSEFLYVSGRDIYDITRNGKQINIANRTQPLIVPDRVNNTIRSNYNLNYLNTTEDIVSQIITLNTDTANNKQVLQLINSATLSYIYELQSMYKDFYNVVFNKVTEYSKIQFDNTIRVSDTLADESFNNSIFTFDPTAYYNIPTDRGIIIKLFSITNGIFVHTESSLYKFDANSVIMSNQQDIQLKESNPFDKGIVQLFDSQYGYGGLKNKEAGCITFNFYFFYDSVTKHIYACGGTDQLNVIDDTINKILQYYSPNFCRTLHDEQNDRILFEFSDFAIDDNSVTIKHINSFCISYNYKTKTFISIHDLTLNNAFNSRFGCYSYNLNKCISLFYTNIAGFSPNILHNDNGKSDEENTKYIYGDATVRSMVVYGNNTYKENKSPFNVSIIFQVTDTDIEALDSVSYLAHYVNNLKPIVAAYDRTLYGNKQRDDNNPVMNFYITTDHCISSVTDTTINYKARPNPLDYEGFKYHLGRWYCNYFRNELNDGNVYKYPRDTPARHLVSDDNSLVYGRYFILTFEFYDSLIKIEDVTVNSKQY